MNGMSGIDLPAIHLATLDHAMVDQLFYNIAARAELFEVSFKIDRDARTAVASLDLEGAHAAFVSGSVLGVQLWYRLRDKVWLDTIVHVGNEIRLVRVEHAPRVSVERVLRAG
jgi:hypothetical protein